MAPSLLRGHDLDALRDEEDCVRRALSEFVCPQTLSTLTARFEDFSKSGMVTLLPSKKPYTTCDLAKIIDELLAAQWIHKLAGNSWRKVAEHADSLQTTLSHSFPLEDGSRHNRVLDWATAHEENKDEFPSDTFYALTHSGFEALTGHKQGERPESEPEDVVDPADITPAAIGEA